MANWFQWQDDTLTLQLHLQPRASKDEIVGLHGDSLKVRINAPPVDGKANSQLLKFLASQFGVRISQIQLVSGEGSRQKRVAISSPTRLPSPWFDRVKPL